MSFSNAVKDLLFPYRCPSCGEKTPRNEAPLCRSCRREYETVRFSLCPRCNRPNCACICAPRCPSPAVSAYLSVFPYAERTPGGKLILLIKDRKNAAAAGLLAGDMFRTLEKNCILRRDAVVTYVPRSRSAVLNTGTDQARELGRRVASLSGLTFSVTLEHRGTRGAQKGLSAGERAEHAAKSYRLARSCPDLEGRQVVLVDDILTSGATLGACAALLKERGAGQIVCLTAGKTARSH